MNTIQSYYTRIDGDLPNQNSTSKGAGKNSHPTWISKSAYQKLLVLHKLGQIIYKNAKTKITKAKLSNTMPVNNYTKPSMRMGMQRSCPMKKTTNIYKGPNRDYINKVPVKRT